MVLQTCPTCVNNSGWTEGERAPLQFSNNPTMHLWNVSDEWWHVHNHWEWEYCKTKKFNMKSTDVPFMLQQTLFIVFNDSLQLSVCDHFCSSLWLALTNNSKGKSGPQTSCTAYFVHPADRRAFCRLMGQWMHCLCYTIKLTWLFTHPSDLSHFPLISNKLLSAADHSVALHVWFGRDLHRMSFLTQLQRGFVSHLLKSSETELGHILKYIKIQLLMWLCLYVWTWKYLI